MSQRFDSRSCRPRDHVATAGKLYPHAWRDVDRFRADRGRPGSPTWPEWCFLPLGAAHAIVFAGQHAAQLSPDLVADVGRLGALAAWRVTQGIYRFDPAVYDAVRATPLDREIPCDVLYRLPEWCVYVETPEMRLASGALHGFFAHLEWDEAATRTELRLLLDGESILLPLPLHLGAWSLAEACERAAAAGQLHAVAHGITLPAAYGAPMSSVASALAPLVSLLLYLCSQAAEIGAGDRRPANPQPKRTKAGWRLFPADRPTTWDVGVRLGAALRRAYQAEQTGTGDQHAGPRAHIRRAHWHGFWSGPRKRPDGSEAPAAERLYEVRWMPPIAVNVDDIADLPAVVRRVRPEAPK